MKKKKKIIVSNNDKTEKLKKNIINHNNELPLLFKNKHKYIETNSWFTIKEYDINDENNRPQNIKVNTKFKKEKIIKCCKVKMILNEEQRKILNLWFDAYTKTYNEAVRHIKSKFLYCKSDILRETLINDSIKDIYDFYKLRGQMTEIKKEIRLKTQLEDVNKNTKIRIHNLDYAIKQLCSNIESAITNLRRNNIKKFRIKYWKNDRISKTIELEKECVKNNNICFNILGNIKYYYNGSEVELCNINSDIKINYNKLTNEYTLLIPIKVSNKTTENKNHNLISLDPGLRTFMTGVSEDGFVKIGDKVNEYIGNSIYRLNNIKSNELIKNKIKKKNEIIINRKISNKIDDLHWKTINYLVQNYTTILLGDMSAKDIVKKNNSVLNNIQKVACLRTKYYEFRMKLEYKCKLNNVNYKLVDESYTSKTCSYCGNIKDNLRDAKIYNCNLCGITIDRDVNGSRNIYLKSINDNQIAMNQNNYEVI